MTCLRCQGLMVPDHVHDPCETLNPCLPAARCLNCGAIVDAVILQNRARQQHDRWLIAEAELLAEQAAARMVGRGAGSCSGVTAGGR